MIVLSFFQWWYTSGWLTCARRLSELMLDLSRFFSLTILLKTLFAPWKRTIDYKHPNASIQQRLHMIVGNLISRFIGFLIRTVTILVAFATLAGVAVIGVGALIVWPLLPIIIVINIGKGTGF